MDYPMEVEEVHPGFNPWQWRLFAILSSAAAAVLQQQTRRQPNHVRWEETAATHLFSTNLPGVRKEEIRVEVEDARYLFLRTELLDADADALQDRGRRSFERKFRLPGMVDAEGISAEYTHGVLTVTIPRMHTRLHPAVVGLLGAGPTRDAAARAA